ncbi:hypothetical protein [Halocatena salina]|uniref:Uncharacterized protein n=1 Tax=Halocatena salina TaxID=2934340 RepID=A0A8U0A3U0_9EURY|nr:hypothetical protein [Halocatena salina]UPM43875.1 hypothetical protein MW046_05375 [Halocatena salina]
MEEKINRRSLLGTIGTAAVGVTGVSLLPGSAKAASHCGWVTMAGKKGTAEYEAKVDGDVNHSTTTEGNDHLDDSATYTSTFGGKVNSGYDDDWALSGRAEFHYVHNRGGGLVIETSNNCGDSIGEYHDSIEITISGNGQYSIGFWNSDTNIIEHNIEGDEFKGCYPVQHSGGAKLQCYWDVEGVTSRNGWQLVTGEVASFQYEDRYTVDSTAGPSEFYLEGDVNVDITYN